MVRVGSLTIRPYVKVRTIAWPFAVLRAVQGLRIPQEGRVSTVLGIREPSRVTQDQQQFFSLLTLRDLRAKQVDRDRAKGHGHGHQ